MNKQGNLQNKVAIITGGGSGIGKATAIQMAQLGVKVIITGRTASKIQAVAQEIIETGGIAKAISLDVADHKAVHEMAKMVQQEFGRIDILINNAGHSSNNRRLLSITPEEIHAVINTNLIGTMYCAQAVAQAMLEQKSGTIINVSSLAALHPSAFSGMAYGPAKAAVINFTEFLNEELKNTGIRATVFIPGEVNTPILNERYVPPSQDARELMVGVEETAEAICMIASLPQRTNIPKMIIRPTFHRDMSGETEPMVS
ncbi:MAG: SDR family oxidoreductase [Bacteroidota bacterium]